MAIFYLPLYTLGIAIAAVILLNLLRRSGTFTIKTDGILLNGTLYPLASIQSLYIKSPSGDISNRLTSTGTGFVVISNDRVQTIGLGTAGAVGTAVSGVVSAATQVSAASGRAIKSSIKRKSFKICFQYGGSEKILVRQVSEQAAIQILQQIDTLI